MKKFYIIFVSALATIGLQAQVVLQNHSVTPSLLFSNKDIPNLEVYNLFSSEDSIQLNGSSTPKKFTFGGSADGAGVWKRSNGEYGMLINNEDNFTVSRVYLDATFKPVRGEYVMRGDAGRYRLCSATLATVAEHGFSKFLTCGESSIESQTHGFDPETTTLYTSITDTTTTLLKGLGRWSAENAVPLHKDAYAGKTVILIGDDDSGNNGQLAAYISNTVGDLENGNLYVLRRTDLNQVETQMTLGTAYDVEFVQIANQKTLTGKQIETACNTTLKALAIGRVEDIDYRKGSAANAREVYFTATGQGSKNVAPTTKTKFGRVYRLKMDANDPLKGTLEVILDGDVETNNPTPLAAKFMNPDNICVTQDYVYVQEDPNAYGDAREDHDARIYQYAIATGEMKTVMELNHRRGGIYTDSLKFNNSYNGTTGENVYSKSGTGRWEYGAMVDISEIINVPNTFVIALQPHSFLSAKFKNPDGSSVRTTESQGSMMVVVKNIPRVSGTNSISDAEAEQAGFNVYPNPAIDQLTVELPTGASEAEVKIVNGAGMLVASKTISSDERINISQLKAGFYLVSVSANGKIYTKKVNKY